MRHLLAYSKNIALYNVDIFAQVLWRIVDNEISEYWWKNCSTENKAADFN